MTGPRPWTQVYNLLRKIDAANNTSDHFAIRVNCQKAMDIAAQQKGNTGKKGKGKTVSRKYGK